MKIYGKTCSVVFGVAILLGLELSDVFAEEPPSLQIVEVEFQKLLDHGLSAFIDEKYAESVGSFGEALKIKPGDKTALNALKSAELKFSKQHSTKIPIHEKELDKVRIYIRQKQYVVALIGLRSVLLQAPQYKSALRLKDKLNSTMKKIIKKENQDSYRFWVYRGVINCLEDLPAAAIEDWRKALILHANDQIVEFAIQELQGDYKPSVAVTSMVDESKPCDCDLSSSTQQVKLFEPLRLPVFASTTSAILATLESDVNRSAVLEIATAKKVSAVPLSEVQPRMVSLNSVDLISAVIRQSEALAKKMNFKGAVQLLEDWTAKNSSDLKAKEKLNQISFEWNRSSSVHYHLGLLAYAQGDFAQAIEEWKTTLQINPDHPSAKKVILRAFFKLR